MAGLPAPPCPPLLSDHCLQSFFISNLQICYLLQTAGLSFVILTLDQPRHESQQSVVKYLQVISVDPFRILLAQPDHCIEMQRCANISYKYLGDIIWLPRLSCPAPLDNTVRGII